MFTRFSPVLLGRRSQGLIDIFLDDGLHDCGDDVAEEEGGKETGEQGDHERDFGGDPDFVDVGVFEGFEVAGFVEVVGDAGEFAFAVDEFFQRPDELGLCLLDVHLVAEEGVGHLEVVFGGVVDDEAEGDEEEEEDGVGEDDPGPGHDGGPDEDSVHGCAGGRVDFFPGDKRDEDGEGHHGFGVGAAEDEAHLEEGVHQGNDDGDEDEVVVVGEPEKDVLEDEEDDAGGAHDDPEDIGGVPCLDVGVGGVEEDDGSENKPGSVEHPHLHMRYPYGGYRGGNIKECWFLTRNGHECTIWSGLSDV